MSGPDPSEATPASYRGLFAVPGFRALAAATVLGRTGVSMVGVALVLLALQRYHSASLAGAAVFVSIFPSLLASPLAGALLDRYGRARLIRLDYGIAALCLGLLAVLSWVGLLGVPLLLVLVFAGGITGLLSAAGVRSIVPVLLPPELWSRGNAADSAGFTLTSIIGPAAAGVLAGTLGPEAAIAAAAACFAAGALSLLGMRKEAMPRRDEPLLAAARAGLGYAVRHPVLRGLAIALGAINVGGGIVVVAMPVLALRTLHSDPSTVGFLLAVQGVAGAVTGVMAGRVRTENQETRVIIVTSLVIAAGNAAMAVAPSVAWLYVASAAIGAAIGPLDVTLFSLRQRTVPSAWFGRAVAISMSLNFGGMPVGSALGGVILGQGPRFVLLVAALVGVAGGLLALWLLPGPARTAELAAAAAAPAAS